MTEEIKDPCLELEETVEEVGEAGATTLPVDQNRVEVPRSAFPVRRPERIDELILRESSIINQQYFVSQMVEPKIRHPQDAYLLQEWSSLEKSTIDIFRYISGKNFFYNSDTNIQAINPGNSVNINAGVPYSLDYDSSIFGDEENVEVKLIFDRQATETVASHTEDFQASEDVDHFIFWYINPDANRTAVNGSMTNPLIPITYHAYPDVRKFEDVFFTAPAAFFESEVEQSTLPMIESVSITPVVGDLPIEEGGVETSKQSLYRLYANLNIDSEIPERFSNDILQKYASSQVNLIGDINTAATSIVVGSPFFSEANKIINTHIKISLNLNHKSEIASLLKDHGFDSILLDFLPSNVIEASPIPKFIQVLDQSEFGDAVNNRLVYNYEPKTYEASKFLDIIHGNVIRNANSILSAKSHHPLSYDNSDPTDLRNILNDNFYSRDLKRGLSQIVNNKLRTIEDIFFGKTAQSEVLAFRIEKIDTESDEVLQNFYIFNDQETEYLDFLDTQVVYKKRYTYRIYAINYVIGNEYTYEEIEEDKFVSLSELRSMTNPEYKFFMRNKAKSYIIETPYFQQNTIMLDKPPLFPEYDIVPFAGSSTKIAFRLTPSYGKLKEKPIQILNSDAPIIQDMILAQDEFSDEIEYVGDTLPTKYQVLFTKEPPINYLSFSTAKSVIVDSNGNSGYVELELEPNTKYYLVFRAIDNAGISNPSLVYCLNLNAYVDGTYVEFDEYDLLQEELDQPIVFDNLVKIEPSQSQMSIDFEGANEQGFYLQAPNIEDLSLGLVESERLWMRRFKFRLISQNTNKAIDLNVRFKYDKIIPLRNIQLPLDLQDLDVSENASLLDPDAAGPGVRTAITNEPIRRSFLGAPLDDDESEESRPESSTVTREDYSQRLGGRDPYSS